MGAEVGAARQEAEAVTGRSGGTATEAPAGARRVVLDPVTRQRVRVASASANALEAIMDAGAWGELDPVIASHMRRHARRLASFLAKVRGTPGIRACESELLSIRRIERRLEVVLELVGEERRDAAAEGDGARREGIFLGDFTDLQLTETQREQVRERRRARKEAKRLVQPATLRMIGYVALGLFVAAGSALLVALSDFGSSTPARAVQPDLPFSANDYLEDLRIFLPAKASMVGEGTATVVVARDWLLQSAAEREEGARGARVFLQNRAIHRFILAWEDGTVIATADREGPLVFEESSGAVPAGPPVP